jgi:hypothetical protein
MNVPLGTLWVAFRYIHERSPGSAAWHEVASDVQQHAQAAIDTSREFRTVGDLAAFACR